MQVHRLGYHCTFIAMKSQVNPSHVMRDNYDCGKDRIRAMSTPRVLSRAFYQYSQNWQSAIDFHFGPQESVNRCLRLIWTMNSRRNLSRW